MEFLNRFLLITYILGSAISGLALAQTEKGTAFVYASLKHPDKEIQKKQIEELELFVAENLKNYQWTAYPRAQRSNITKILKKHQFISSDPKMEPALRKDLEQEKIACLILIAVKDESGKLMVSCQVLPVAEGKSSEEFAFKTNAWNKVSIGLEKRLGKISLLQAGSQNTPKKPESGTSNPIKQPEITKPNDTTKNQPNTEDPNKTNIKSGGTDKNIKPDDPNKTQIADNTKNVGTKPPSEQNKTLEGVKNTDKTSLPDSLTGWFGETMPQNMSRKKTSGEYLWQKDGSTLVYIQAGEFYLGKDPHTNPEGSEDELPNKTVNLPSYYMDKYEVSNYQYCLFLNDVKKIADEKGHSYIEMQNAHSGIFQDGDLYRPKPGAQNYPVVKVSWYGAFEYAKWAGKQLPSELQWEKAAKGGLEIPDWKSELPIRLITNHLEKRMYPWDDMPVTTPFSKANYKGSEDGYAWLAPVNAYDGLGDSPYSCVQMAGNVWEWTADWYDKEAYKKSPAETLQEGSTKVCRGGSWGSDVKALRCSYRYAVLPEKANNDLGFRCVLNLEDHGNK